MSNSPSNAARQGKREAGKLRWWLWAKLTRLPGVCPANAHSRLIWKNPEQSVRVDGMCRRDLGRNGTCWCGKLRASTDPVASDPSHSTRGDGS